jgi:tetratricopeptide (TPR) repeat protein
MWRPRPVFVSSTFLDMQAERDYLRDRVFPEIEELLRHRRQYLEWVDLRVGVPTAEEKDEATRELKVLTTCLAEVDRCRPYLIVLLGDRYGWVPPADRMAVAATEVGFAEDIAGRSVTELEIAFGALSNPEQIQRTLFYFRKPLPYASMPPEAAAMYCDGFDPDDEAGREQAQKLEALKERIRRSCPAGQIAEYSATWNANGRGIAEFNDWTVRADLLRLFEADMPEQAPADGPWSEEREALDSFIADRTRTFIGRADVLKELADLALGPEETTVHRLVCLTGAPGSGKSAVFSALHQRLASQDRGALILSHAAGTSPSSSSVDGMLRRWCDELAAASGTESGVSDDTHPQVLDARFAELLADVAGRRRVVLVIDALDQFTPTTRALHCAWLPEVWPENARLIATTLPGPGSEAIARRGGRTDDLAEIERPDAARIIAGVCSHYRRQLESQVVDRLLDRPDRPWRNPLWLTLAVEEINLISADEISRARTYAGNPAQQLQLLMLDIVDGLPGDVQGLYEGSFKRAEHLFGVELTRAFLGLLGVGRLGWREADFRKLLPNLAGMPWDELAFAQLRRHFRGQLRLSTSSASWTFSHQQMRLAVERRTPAETLRQLHTTIADHLRALPEADPLRTTETMVHLLGSRDFRAAAEWYIWDMEEYPLSVQHPPAHVHAATSVLATPLLSGAASGDDSPANAFMDVEAMIDATAGDDRRACALAHRIMHNLAGALDSYASDDVRIWLFELCARTIEPIAFRQGHNALVLWLSAIAYTALGAAQKEAGLKEAALDSFRASNAICDRLRAAKADMNTPEGQNNSEIGEILAEQGEFKQAIELYKNAERGMSNLRERLIVRGRLGLAYLAQGDLEEAHSLYSQNLELMTMLDEGRLNPRDFPDVAIAHKTLADVLVRMDRLEEAFRHYAIALSLVGRLLEQDPRRRDYYQVYQAVRHARDDAFNRQNDLLVEHAKRGARLAQEEAFEPALAEYSRALAITQRMIDLAEPGAIADGPRTGAAKAQFQRANMLAGLGRFSEAAAAFDDAARRAQDLVEQLPDRGDMARLASAARELSGQVTAKGAEDDAAAAHERSADVAAASEKDDAAVEMIKVGRDLIRMQVSIANKMSSEGRLDQASAALQEARKVALGVEAVDARFCEGGFLDILAGDIELKRGNGGAAAGYYRAAAERARRLLSAEPAREDCRLILDQATRTLQRLAESPTTSTRVSKAAEGDEARSRQSPLKAGAAAATPPAAPAPINVRARPAMTVVAMGPSAYERHIGEPGVAQRAQLALTDKFWREQRLAEIDEILRGPLALWDDESLKTLWNERAVLMAKKAKDERRDMLWGSAVLAVIVSAAIWFFFLR